MIRKLGILIGIPLVTGYVCVSNGFSTHQALAIAIFLTSILGTLFFWSIRLTFAFLGTSLLLITQTINLDHVIKFSSLEVILFLVGMMVLVGLMKETGFFAWIVSLMLRARNQSGVKFFVSLTVISALLACVVDEVTSIIFVVAAVFEICDYFEVEPTPFLIIAILATNIGSTGTVLGNPIGILIATKSGLTFEDFIVKAFPIMLLCLGVLLAVGRFWFRAEIRGLDRKMKELEANEILIRLISVPPERELKISLSIFGVTLCAIAMHHRLELLLGLEANTLLLTMPLISSALVMLWKKNKARKFIEHDVEWWTLLFFLLLFAQAGTLKYTGATDVLARHLLLFAQQSTSGLTGLILWITAFGSSLLDNVVLVAAFIPVIQSFGALSVNLQPLWWALLFGGCLGGNITMIGSTANIVALGILEKERNMKIGFFQWLRIGFVVGVLTTALVWFVLWAVPFYQG